MWYKFALTYTRTSFNQSHKVTTSLPKYSEAIFNRHQMSKSIYRLVEVLDAEHQMLVSWQYDVRLVERNLRILNHALDQIFEHRKHHVNCSKWKIPFPFPRFENCFAPLQSVYPLLSSKFQYICRMHKSKTSVFSSKMFPTKVMLRLLLLSAQ